jgi:hypothetical protein
MLICSQCIQKLIKCTTVSLQQYQESETFYDITGFGILCFCFFFWKLLDVNEPINLCTCNYWYRITNVTALLSIVIVTTGNGANTLV